MAFILDIEWPSHEAVTVDYDLTDRQAEHFLSSEYVRAGPHQVIHVENMFSADNRVPDVQRYSWGTCGCGSEIHLCRHRDAQPARGRQAVVILESPHIYEYGNAGLAMSCPIAPAMGVTGTCLDEHLGSLLRTINMSACEVVISNPVQFQTSLYVIHRGDRSVASKYRVRKITDAVFRGLWAVERIQTNFRNRMNIYRPELIINACTYSLRDDVGRFLELTFPSVNYRETNHPGSWTNPLRRYVVCRGGYDGHEF